MLTPSSHCRFSPFSSDVAHTVYWVAGFMGGLVLVVGVLGVGEEEGEEGEKEGGGEEEGEEEEEEEEEGKGGGQDDILIPTALTST